jgi:pimeloyl-ACP methyl ester carboxylesterase
VKERAGFSLDSIDLLKIVPEINIPVIFICSKDDTFIKSTHTEKLANLYKGSKRIIHVTGNHNEDRPKEIICDAVKFFEYHFAKED